MQSGLINSYHNALGRFPTTFHRKHNSLYTALQANELVAVCKDSHPQMHLKLLVHANNLVHFTPSHPLFIEHHHCTYTISQNSITEFHCHHDALYPPQCIANPWGPHCTSLDLAPCMIFAIDSLTRAFDTSLKRCSPLTRLWRFTHRCSQILSPPPMYWRHRRLGNMVGCTAHSNVGTEERTGHY